MGLLERGVLFQLFWIPAGVSAGLLVMLWAQGTLPKYATAFVAWFLVAGAVQAFATTPIAWALGLVMQTALAVVLLIAHRLALS